VSIQHTNPLETFAEPTIAPRPPWIARHPCRAMHLPAAPEGSRLCSACVSRLAVDSSRPHISTLAKPFAHRLIQRPTCPPAFGWHRWRMKAHAGYSTATINYCDIHVYGTSSKLSRYTKQSNACRSPGCEAMDYKGARRFASPVHSAASCVQARQATERPSQRRLSNQPSHLAASRGLLPTDMRRSASRTRINIPVVGREQAAGAIVQPES